ncbi:MAG: IS1595 family transposase [Bacteroidota bacterium]
MATFKNLHDLYKAFPNEEVAYKHLEELRWKGTVVCPHCGVTKTPYRLRGLGKFKCSDKDCAKKFSTISGTIFENTKVPLQKWFLAIYIATAHKKGISSLQLSRDLGITQKTAWFVLHRIREMLTDKAPIMLTGVISVDETYVGGKLKNKHKHQRVKAKPGRGSQNKTMVFGLLQENGKVVNYMVKNADIKTLSKIMADHVEKGSTIVTDGYHAYKRLSANYTHVVVDHNKDIYVVNGLSTNNLEGYWSLLKRGIVGIYHYVSPKHLHRYCNEFAFRYNSREDSEAIRFDFGIEQAEGKRLTYNNLIRK